MIRGLNHQKIQVDKTTADPLVGKTVAQYEVVAKLGGGGMGIVYAARDTKLGRRVALKFLPPQWSHDDSAKQRFIREAQAASATDHRNICTIHDIDAADDGQLFIVMAHYDGQTLKQRLEAGALSVDEALDIAAQVAEGLAKAHAQGVVHRDIKPGNLMLTEDGVKILDFGLAKFADVRFKLTQEGSTLGTVSYMSPEQARGEEADHRTDIWAIGVVLYEMLTGGPPFKGGYPEAISYAIKNDPPPPLRVAGCDPAISEALEQLVFRALHKSPAIRFQSARDLARALRLLQGRTLPLDLRTEPLPLVEPGVGRDLAARPRRWWTTRAGLTAAAAVIALTVGTPLWLFSPIERVPVAVAPVANQTGDSQLDAYRLALTQELIATLANSPGIRVVPFDRTLQIVRRFGLEDGDVSSREAVQALTTQTGARVVILPTLIREGGAWKARVEFHNADTATNLAGIDTPAVVSSLVRDTVYGLMGPLSALVEEHFRAAGPRRAGIAHRLRALAGWEPATPPSRFRALDAAAAFAQGTDAYDQIEYTLALRSFASASQQDPRHALPRAWTSRVAWLMRHDKEAVQAGDEALALVTNETPARDALFTAAVATEARRDFTTAEARHRELVEHYPDEPVWLMELAGFQDRRLQTTEAVATYLEALRIDQRLARPRLELCRLYARLNDSPHAREQGGLALAGYRALGNGAGEAQALWCLADVLRNGNDAERAEARQDAERALEIVKGLEFPYNLSRAEYYVGLAAYFQGNLPEAAAWWDRSLVTARTAANAPLESLLLMNLGATYEALGNRSRASDYYQQSHTFFEALGDEARAAQVQSNRAALLIEYGPDPDEGLREMQNALVVSQKLGDKIFEVFCRRNIAASHQHAGRYEEAEAEFNRALAISRERSNRDDIALITIDLARLRFDTGDYAASRTMLLGALEGPATPRSPEARIRLGKADVRLGNFDAAASSFAAASDAVRLREDVGLALLLNTARGELAYELGRLDDARTYFEMSSAQWTDDLPNEHSVEARAYAGLVDALQGRIDRGRTALRQSLEQARKTRRFSLEVRSLIALARIEVSQRQFDAALMLLREVPADGERRVGRELLAQVHYWRGQALLGRGDRQGAQTEIASARTLVAELQASWPDADQKRFAVRRDIRVMVE